MKRLVAASLELLAAPGSAPGSAPELPRLLRWKLQKLLLTRLRPASDERRPTAAGPVPSSFHHRTPLWCQCAVTGRSKKTKMFQIFCNILLHTFFFFCASSGAVSVSERLGLCVCACEFNVLCCAGRLIDAVIILSDHPTLSCIIEEGESSSWRLGVPTLAP